LNEVHLFGKRKRRRRRTENRRDGRSCGFWASCCRVAVLGALEAWDPKPAAVEAKSLKAYFCCHGSWRTKRRNLKKRPRKRKKRGRKIGRAVRDESRGYRQGTMGRPLGTCQGNSAG